MTTDDILVALAGDAAENRVKSRHRIARLELLVVRTAPALAVALMGSPRLVEEEVLRLAGHAPGPVKPRVRVQAGRSEDF